MPFYATPTHGVPRSQTFDELSFVALPGISWCAIKWHKVAAFD
jgi:hypothetical protein